MKYIVLLFILIAFIACDDAKRQNRESALPDSTLINSVIQAVIKIDSLENNFSILRTLRIPPVYKFEKWDTTKGPPLPPPPFSISYDELFFCFGSDLDEKLRNLDSLYVAEQISQTIELVISDSIINTFGDNPDKLYNFFLPIFSHNRDFVLIQYWIYCGSLCGSCHILVFKRENNKWIKIRSWGCGVS
jgi:hypothetical protein